MSVHPNTVTTVKMNNILIDSYLRKINQKLFANKKPSIFEYILFSFYFIQIIHQFICLHVNDHATRLYLFDLNLFIGGIRQYNSSLFIFGSIFGLFMFKYIHFSTDKRLMKWIEVLELIREENDLVQLKFINDNYGDMARLKKVVKLLYWVIIGFHLGICK